MREHLTRYLTKKYLSKYIIFDLLRIYIVNDSWYVSLFMFETTDNYYPLFHIENDMGVWKGGFLFKWFGVL